MTPDTPAARAPAAKFWSPAELRPGGGELRAGHHWLLAAVLLFFITAVTWASLASLDEVTRGEGRIITASQVQVVQNLEGGIVSEILAREGDAVDKGQILFRLEDVRFDSPLREGRKGTLALQARVARLQAEASGAALSMSAAMATDAPDLAANERALFEARQRELASKHDVLAQQLLQRKQELEELKTRGERLNEQMALLKKEIAITSPLVAQGVVSEVEMLRLEREATRLRTDVDAAAQAIPRVEASIEEAKQRLEDIRHAFVAQAAADLAQARGELAKLAETLPALQDRVARTAVRSPVKGLVKQVFVKTSGGVVQPGSPMAEVVASEDTLLVEARLRPADIAFVAPGQSAVVKIAAYDYSIYGGLEGNIEMVSAD